LPQQICFRGTPGFVKNAPVRGILSIILGFWLCGVFVAAGADTYPLTDGTSLVGDVISYNDNGIVFRLDGDKYSERMPWTKFSQDALKQLSANPKIRLLAEPFIETVPVAARTKKAEASFHEANRMELPPKQSLFGALFSSSVGLVALMLIYAANIFAGYEVAVIRSRPIAMVMGLAVVLPILGPLIFLVMPVRVAPPEPETAPDVTASQQQTFTVPGAAQPAAAPPPASGIHIVEASWQGKSSSPAGSQPGEPQIFQRGQFTFNRRFFETKFSGFFAMVRRESEKNLMLTVKTGRATLNVERITRIATNEMHVEVLAGAARQEVSVSFAEIIEVQLKPKSE
jgi:hypothetical protein